MHERLEEHRQNEVKYDRLHILILAPSIVVLLFGVLNLMWGLLSIWTGILLSIIGIVGFFIAGHFVAKAAECRYSQEDYIMVKIMDVIGEQVCSDNFQIVASADGTQFVTFHNVNVDYETVQAKVDEELRIMNKIAHKDFRVKLL